MRIKTLLLSIIYLGIICCLIFSCGSGKKNNETNNITNDSTELIKSEPKIDYPKDSTQNEIAKLLSGISSDAFKNVFTDNMDFWSDYKNSIDTPWTRITNERLSKMDVWSEKEISSKINDTTLLFYPFSGPDFLNVYHLFPNANEYVLVAMEKLGTIPNLYDMNEENLKGYLDAVNFAIRDIYKRSYFITGNMDQDLRKHKVDGVLPLMYVFLQKTGHEIFEFGYYRLENDAKTFTKIEKPTNTLTTSECIKFKVLKKGDKKLKDVTYFYADISDDGFKKNPVFLQYLHNLRNYNTFIKSASYLSHYETFSNIRNTILDKAYAVLEDDTGIPFRYFYKDNSNSNKWDYYLYGVYAKPIDDFQSTYLFQKDLNQKYQTEDVKSLDFSLGYHWRSGNQNWVLYVKRNN
jgi:hypothetical protein